MNLNLDFQKIVWASISCPCFGRCESFLVWTGPCSGHCCQSAFPFVHPAKRSLDNFFHMTRTLFSWHVGYPLVTEKNNTQNTEQPGMGVWPWPFVSLLKLTYSIHLVTVSKLQEKIVQLDTEKNSIEKVMCMVQSRCGTQKWLFLQVLTTERTLRSFDRRHKHQNQVICFCLDWMRKWSQLSFNSGHAGQFVMFMMQPFYAVWHW